MTTETYQEQVRWIERVKEVQETRPRCFCGATSPGEVTEIGEGNYIQHEATSCRRVRRGR